MARTIYFEHDFTENGTKTYNFPSAVEAVSFTVVGVGGTPSAWDIDVDGSMGFGADDTAVELDGHNNGVEALGAVVNVAVTTKVVTQIDVVLASLNLNSATSLQLQMVVKLQ